MIVKSILLYLGPGLFGGVVAATIGIVVSLFVTLIAIIWYPFKKLIRFLKAKLRKDR